MKAKPNTERLNVYQIVTDRIITSLKSGVIPWEKPWKAPTFAGGSFPRNFRTGKPYRGVNVFLLWGTQYSSPFWLTFKQALELGGNVRKGEKGSMIVFYKQLRSRNTKAEDATTEPETSAKDRAPFVLTYYTVFNVEQCEGLKVPTIEEPIKEPVDVDATCEAIVNSWEGRPTLRTEIETETRAYYRPSTDSVHLPARFRFVDTAHYYAVLFHELIHSTGHESRLARPFGERFGDELYSKEELVAETGAAFLCAIAGIATQHTERNTTAYIQNWISKLEQDNRLLVQAAASAQRAVDLIIGQSFANDEEEGDAGDAGRPCISFDTSSRLAFQPSRRLRIQPFTLLERNLLMHVAIASFKGGVGKTTTAIHIAAYLQNLAPTLLLDGDASHNALEWAEIGPKPSFRVADVRSAMKLSRDYTHSVIDTGQRPVIADMKALAEGCDLLIIPAAPGAFDSMGLRQTIEALKSMEADNYRVLITKAPPPNEPEAENLRAALKRADVPTFTTAIPRLKAFEKAAASGMLVSQVQDPRALRAWEAYELTGKEVLKYANSH